MNKTIFASLGCCIAALASPAMAADAMPADHMQMEFKMMDTNADGLVSKTEYMAYHEKMWMGMKKDANGMVEGNRTPPTSKMPEKN